MAGFKLLKKKQSVIWGLTENVSKCDEIEMCCNIWQLTTTRHPNHYVVYFAILQAETDYKLGSNSSSHGILSLSDLNQSQAQVEFIWAMRKILTKMSILSENCMRKTIQVWTRTIIKTAHALVDHNWSYLTYRSQQPCIHLCFRRNN